LNYLSYLLAIYLKLRIKAMKKKVTGKLNAGILVLEIVPILTKE